ncbi:MAG: hypothetical protein VX278_08450 [Myxococcota bacterium]|nr:hypothetical protein [Myxococcota bacterium]
MGIPLVLELLCLVLVGWAAYLSQYKPPQFDWRSSFLNSLLPTPDTNPNLYQPIPSMMWSDFSADKVQQRLRTTLSSVVIFSAQAQREGAELAQLLDVQHHNLPEDVDAEWIANRVETKNQRLVFIARGESVQAVLKLLHKHPGMRDRLFCVVLIDAVLDASWMSEYFSQEKMDVEMNSAVPYISLAFSAQAEPLEEPPIPPTGWHSIRVIPLGLLEEVPVSRMSLALAILMGNLY